MRITILSAGSQGDIQPFVILGQALQKAGYTVHMAVPQNFEPLIRKFELNFDPISVDFQQLLNSDAGRKLVASGQKPVQVMREGNRLMSSTLWQMVQDFWDVCQDTDAIICHIGLMVVAKSIADKLAVPLVIGALQPFAPTSAFPHPMWPMQANLGAIYNRLTGKIMEQVTWQIFRSATNRLRREKLNMPSVSAAQIFKSVQGIPVLNAISVHIVPRPADWGANQHITGFWFSDVESDWQPPEGLSKFLKSGAAPVSIGFGSMTGAERPTQIALDVLKKIGQRGLVVGGSISGLPDSVFQIDYAPYEWLFPRMAAVVYHGGAGTSAQVWHAGVPAVIVPFVLDQFYWGQRAAQLGVAPQPLPSKNLNVDRLADAIQIVMNTHTIRHSAAELGEKIRTENGIANTVKIISEHLRTV